MARVGIGQSDQLFFRRVSIAHGFANVISRFTQCPHGASQRIFPYSRRSFGGGRYCLQGVSLTKLTQVLGLDKSVVSRRVQAAEAKGYLVNLEDGKGKSACLTIGEPLPEDVDVLHTAEALDCCSVA
jgi:hypothetical protein